MLHYSSHTINESRVTLYQKVYSYIRSVPPLYYVAPLVIILFLVALFSPYLYSKKPEKLTYYEEMARSKRSWTAAPKPLEYFLTAGKQNQLVNVGIDSDSVLYTMKNGERHSTALPHALTMTDINQLMVQGAHVNQLPTSTMSELVQWFGGMGMLGMTIGLAAMYFYSKREPDNLAGDGSLRKEADATDSVTKPNIRFADVIGADHAKKTLLQVKSFLTDPAKYAELGAKPYRGVLLEGPPGTGKTLLAKALAGECGANFIAVDGSHFSSNLMGNGIRKVEALFKKAREKAPCIIFIDEFDGIGKRKSDTSSAAADEDNRIINKLLVELDGFSPTEGVIVLAATNHRENLDEAMLRDGRFDATVQVNLPTLTERRGLFDMYLGKVKSDSDVDAVSLARMSSGMSPAAIAGVVNRAAVLAADLRASSVTQEHVLRALETKQLGGEPNGSRMLTEKTRKRISVHEAGHALVGHLLRTGVVERVSIEPRGQALGVTYITQEDEDSLFEPEHLSRRLSMMLAGREAELLVLGNTSSGAADDLRRATELATTMIGRLGFSESFGLLSLDGLPAQMVGSEVRNALLQECLKSLSLARDHARNQLEAHREALDALTEALLRDETIGPDVLKDLLPLPSVH